MYNYYYLLYKENANVNYIYLLYLYKIAERYTDDIEYDFKKHLKTDISFKSFKELEIRINTLLKQYQKKDNKGKLKTLISETTLSRIVSKKEYSDFFFYDKFGDNKLIILNNDFSKGSYNKNKSFVRLSPLMVNLLLEEQDNLLAQYIIYIIHSCGIHNNSADFTAIQFLQSAGYSLKANNYKSKVSDYNNLLKEKNIISIKSWRDEAGRMRNTYSLINYDVRA